MRKEYIIKRIFLTIFVIFGVLVITFVLSRIIPGDPAALWVGAHPTKEQLERARKELHLDEPYFIQFIYYLKDVFSGSFGISYRTRTPVIKDIKTALPATLELMFFSFTIALLVGIPLGVLAGTRRGSYVDHLVRILGVSGASIPPFWLALVLQFVLGNTLGIFPLTKRVDDVLRITTGFKPITGFYLLDSLLQGNWKVFIDVMRHMVLPGITLASYPLALSSRMTRALMVEVLRENYIRSVTAWGLPKNVIVFKYALKNAIIPTIAAVGMSFAYTLVGAFLVEVIFAWPGIGSYAALAMLSLDYPAILGTVIVIAFFYCIVNLVVDIIQAILDPRVRL